MIVHGRTFQDHLRLLSPLFGFIAAVWVLRMLLGFAGVPKAVLHWVSVTLATTVAVFLAVLLIYARRFGGYVNVVFSVFLLAVWEQLLLSGAVAFAALTGTHNIYSAPEYSPLGTPLQHILGHLTFGIGFVTLFGSLFGCALYLLLSRIMPNSSAPTV
jgi:general stress protein CsbA